MGSVYGIEAVTGQSRPTRNHLGLGDHLGLTGNMSDIFFPMDTGGRTRTKSKKKNLKRDTYCFS